MTAPTRPTAFHEVPPAHTDERDLRDTRTRQATFERGIALALISGMLNDIKHLQSLNQGLRWVISNDEAAQIQRWLENAYGDIVRTERIETRYEQS